MPVYADYDECFKAIDPLRLAVGKVMQEMIGRDQVEKREADPGSLQV